MATYGVYQVLDPLYVTPTGSVCSAKIVGGEAAGRIAVKVFTGSGTKPDADEPNWEPKYFLDRAQLQRRVAASGGAHWAPIYALGFTPEGGAYYVTDYHALSAQKMIDGRLPIDATALHAIVLCVLAGLDEIRRNAKRAHANLKPANVLLIGKGPADEMRAVLCDPGTDYKAEKDGDAGDLRALGALIHELVLHRPPVAGSPVLNDDPAWVQRLNGKADAWRQLCADLLAHPIASRVATVDATMKVVATLGPARLKVPHIRLAGRGKSQAAPGAAPPAPARSAATAKTKRARKPAKPRGPSKLKRHLVQFVALLALVGGSVGVLSIVESGAREEVCKARGGWYGSLAAGLADPARRERFEADPHLKRLADDVADVERAGVLCRNGRPALLRFLDVTKARTAVAALHRVEQDLGPEGWPQLAALRDLGETFGKRGWQQPATFVAQLLDGVRPMPGAASLLSPPASTSAAAANADVAPPGNLALRIERVLRLRPIIEQQSATADAEWKQLEERTAALEASNDTTVRNFGEALRRNAIAAIRLMDDGFEGLPQIKTNATLAARVTDALRVSPPGEVDVSRFAEAIAHGGGMNSSASDIGPADVQRWLTERPHYVVQRPQIAQVADALQRAYVATADEVAKSGPDSTDTAAFNQELTDVEASVKELRDAKYVERDIAEGKLTARADKVRDQIAGLKKYYHAENAADWLKNLRPFVATSPRLKNYWDNWVGGLRTNLSQMANDRQVFTQNKARTEKLYDALSDLELNVPPPPDGLTATFAAGAAEHRDERLGALVDRISINDPAIDRDALKHTEDDLRRWFANLKRLNTDFPLRQKVLTLGDRPDLPWRKDEAFWNDHIVQRLIRGDVDRIDRLQKLTTLGRQDLIAQTKADGVRDEVVIAAWQQLGDNRVNPFWPHDVAELKTETTLRARVSTVAGTLEPAAAAGAGAGADAAPAPASLRKTLEETLAREGARRWQRFVESADSPEMLGAAIERQPAFGIVGTTIGEMKPEARFNHSLYLANQAIRENKSTDEATTGLRNVINNLRVAADSLDAAKASRVREKLAKLDVPDPFADRTMRDIFQLPVKGLAEPIEFRKIEPKDPTGAMRPFYIGTREVTLAQFAGAMDGGNLWPEARKLSWPALPGQGDGRRGPRVWEWSGAPDVARLAPPQLWLIPDGRNNFPKEFRGPGGRFNVNVIGPASGGMPSDRHPMQYISAQGALYYAAALSCRLPTSAEWRAALDASGQTAANGKWNLRDQTWEVFRAHAKQNNIAPDQWPDRGAFPADPESAAAEPAPARKGSDDALLLRPEPEAGDGVVRDLVGNVAEFVCEVPDSFARWMVGKKGTAEDVKGFLRETSNAPDVVSVVAVIGGSALSAPDVPIDKPLPVARTDRGFSDVGLRLAFTAPAHNLAERLKWALGGEDYVWPRTASADSSGR